MQADVFSQLAAEFVPLLVAEPTSTAEESSARNLLEKWDFAADGRRPEPLIFAAWYRELTRLVYADELGDEFPRLWRQRPAFMRNVLANREGQEQWCDDIRTPAVENCGTQIRRALSLALADLKQRFGAEMTNWRWADAHMARGRHRPFSRSSWFRRWFEIAVPTPGDSYTVNVGRHDIANEDDPFASDHGPSLRAIYDLADLDRSLFMISTGQSGNVLSPHYDDFADLWRRVDYIAIRASGEDVAAGAKGTLVLERR
jgi:penicillin amidase